MVRRFQIGFGVFLLLCAVNYSALSRSNERGLSQEANMVYKAMKKGDVDTIIKLLADEPTTVTRRTTFWNGIDPRGAAGALKDSEVFPIDDLTRVVWVDRTVYLDKNDRDDLPKLKNALNLFLKVVSNTYGDLRIATSQWDHWETSRLGPSMEGKIASNAYWYVHFRPIGSNWRIWKIEVVLH